ncbi:MAG TPA: SNF2-related protein [bacterium]|nr:SNF2-related protein [bacterium]HPN33061.1 SNF2-related protein [bacterium]
MQVFKIGQRWISMMEPGLGLGIVEAVERDFVDIRFPASRCQRRYAAASAPLRRVEFQPGNTVRSRSGNTLRIDGMEVRDGLLIYRGDGAELPETELSDQMSFTTPVNRLHSGFVDRNRDFSLRYRSLVYQHNWAKSRVRGFIGGRIALLPHQLYVAGEITHRDLNRVLLADETGLGKTIEACLILHRRLVSGSIARVLVLTPLSLVHQWFIELYRKFNLFFRIFDDEYCRSLEGSDAKANPFLDDQLALCSMDFLERNPLRRRQMVAAGWDCVVIDEAHHLTENSANYALAVQISAVCRQLILLSATPEQLGRKSHFSRLQLLDPARYSDYRRFLQEEKRYRRVSALLDHICDHRPLTAAQTRLIEELLPEEPHGSPAQWRLRLQNDPKLQERVIEDLLDQHGLGRVVFRNTRSAIPGFPCRQVHLIPLSAAADRAFSAAADPRISWLVQFLRQDRQRKVLLICKSVEQVLEIEQALRKRMKIQVALFHEKISLLQRDRYAAWFARKDGAQICLCSEIGSEGRNFQFAQHLVLYDLPANPELVDQRIGRLDRIGQAHSIHIHVPYQVGSAEEILALWYHEGLNAFEQNVPGSYQIYRRVQKELERRIRLLQLKGMKTLCQKTAQLRREVSAQMRLGRDRLLQLYSFRPEIAAHLVEGVQAQDAQPGLEKFMLEVMTFYDLRVNYLEERTYRVSTESLSNPEFPLPLMKEEEFTITFDRTIACQHEDWEFLTWDHPMVLGVLDLLLGSEKGNCALAMMPEAEESGFLLEAVYVLECIAPKAMEIDRFLPPRPVRIVVDHTLQDCTEKHSVKSWIRRLREPDPHRWPGQPLSAEQLNAMIDATAQFAERNSQEIRANSRRFMEQQLGYERDRLRGLARKNPNIKPQQVDDLHERMQALAGILDTARLRLDALRLVYCFS